MSESSGFRGRPRLSLAISREQQIDLQNLLPWGVKNAIFRNIIDDVIKILKSDVMRDHFISGMLSRDIHLQDFTPEARKSEKLSSIAEGALDEIEEKRYRKAHEQD